MPTAGGIGAQFTGSYIGSAVIYAGEVPATTRPNLSARRTPLLGRAAHNRTIYMRAAAADFDNRLRASIHFIDLDVRDDPSAIKPAWGYQDLQAHRSYDTVVDAFVAADQRLLLLGHPGSGKSTALVHLAKHLLAQAEDDLEAPVPFIVNLSKFRFGPNNRARVWHAWTHRTSPKSSDDGQSQMIEDWLAAEMTTAPGIKRPLALEWIKEARVAVLLDGLDEFNDDHRAGLVRLLNTTFLREHPSLPVVVCSRTNEYHVLRSADETRLHLRGCVQLQPLTDSQIAEYLKARRATGLLSAIPTDAALQELARTPLTLSILVSAYGGLTPTNLPAMRTLSERRHHLFASYVARMLQRQARKEKRGIPFDDAKGNDVPISEYRYRPEQVQRWLGWLALVLSVGMKTSFSVTNFHTVLSIVGTKPVKQQRLNFFAVYLAVGFVTSMAVLFAISPIVPRNWTSWQQAMAIAVVSWLGVPVVRLMAVEGRVLFIIVVAVFELSVLAHVLAPAMRVRILPMPLSVVLTGVVVSAMAWILALEEEDEFLSIAKASFGGLIAASAACILLSTSSLSYLNTDGWLQMALVWSSASLGIARTDDEFDIWVFFSLAVSVPLLFAVVTAGIDAFGEVSWLHVAFIAVCASTAASALDDISVGIAITAGFAIIVCAGGICAGPLGAVIAIGLYGLLVFLFKVLSPLKTALDRFRNIYVSLMRISERSVLSPFEWSCIAIIRHFPWGRRYFLRFCTDAFLLKQTAHDFEFVHRLLRDYFALCQLLPTIAVSDGGTRLAAIQSLGYQGESALDLLHELTLNVDVEVRAAAIMALGHISSPVVASILERQLGDRAPEVRRATIRSLRTIAGDDQRRILAAMHPLADGCEVEALIDLADNCDYLTLDSIKSFLFHLGASAVQPLLNLLSKQQSYKSDLVTVQALGEIGDARAVDPLLALYVRKKDSVTIPAALGKLGDQRAAPLLSERLRKSKAGSAEHNVILEALRKLRAVPTLATKNRRYWNWF